jgi:hypothetical protein
MCVLVALTSKNLSNHSKLSREELRALSGQIARAPIGTLSEEVSVGIGFGCALAR